MRGKKAKAQRRSGERHHHEVRGTTYRKARLTAPCLKPCQKCGRSTLTAMTDISATCFRCASGKRSRKIRESVNQARKDVGNTAIEMEQMSNAFDELQKKGVRELRAIAKEMGLRNAAGMTKDVLCTMLVGRGWQPK